MWHVHQCNSVCDLCLFSEGAVNQDEICVCNCIIATVEPIIHRRVDEAKVRILTDDLLAFVLDRSVVCGTAVTDDLHDSTGDLRCECRWGS